MTARRFAPLIVAAAFCALGVALGGGCSTGLEASDTSDAIPPYDTATDLKIIPLEVGDDAGGFAHLCGDDRQCDPDLAAICVSRTDAEVADSGAVFDETSPPPSVDAGAVDAPGMEVAGSGSTSACRVVHKPSSNQLTATCAPAGIAAENAWCKSDDDCGAGLACVGEPGLGRCLRYCCGVFENPDDAGADAGGGTHYCTPQLLADTRRPGEKVPVWVRLDNCTLLDDEAICPKGTTCTVVTNEGRTTCVPAGAGRDFASCTTEPCDRGYVCVGTTDRRCRKLCRESDGDKACASGASCQKLPTIPAGFGICSGGDAGMAK